MGVRVKISQGELEGSVKKSENGLDYVRFLGVPYAKFERFAKPAPAPGWEGVKKANSSIKCLQNDSLMKKGIVGKEDGLVANVYTPKSAIEEGASSLPVMVFIHGGAFYLGDGTPEFYGPGWLIDHGILLVTINYRLGPLGFMSTGDDVIPANLVCFQIVTHTSHHKFSSGAQTFPFRVCGTNAKPLFGCKKTSASLEETLEM